METKEYILCAAIWFPEYKTPTHGPKNIGNGVVMCGRRHPDIIGTHASLTGTSLPAAHIQGFLTSENRFVERNEGLKIALLAGQGKKVTLGQFEGGRRIWYYELQDRYEKNPSTAELYSEDLY